MFVIPRDKFSVVDPQRMNVLPPEGRDVGSDHALFWARRIADGDVTEVKGDDAIKAAVAKLDAADAQRAEDARKAAEEKAKADEAAAKAKAEADAKAAAEATQKPAAPVKGSGPK